MLSKRNLFFFQADGAGGGDTGGTEQDDGQENRDGEGQGAAENQGNTGNDINSGNQDALTPVTWEEYLESLDEDAQSMYNEHVKGLKNTVAATREERDTFKQSVTAILDSLEGKQPQEIKVEMENLRNEFTVAQQKIDFLEEAPLHRCRNASVAFIAAKSQNLFSADGSPDWDALKELAPELFGSGIPPAGQGQGTQNPPVARKSANDWMRETLGY